MAKEVLTEELWEEIVPLLPPAPARPKGGRRRLPDRDVLRGILYILHTGTPWEYLPKEMGCGSGMTCWRRLREWQEAGVWYKLHLRLLLALHEVGSLDTSRLLIDAARVSAPLGGEQTGKKSHRSREGREQAPLGHRRAGSASGDPPHRCQSS